MFIGLVQIMNSKGLRNHVSWNFTQTMCILLVGNTFFTFTLSNIGKLVSVEFVATALSLKALL